MSKDKSKIDRAWRKIINRSNILEEVQDQGFSIVESKDLKIKSDQFEPRLLAKMDFSRSRPAVFVENSLNILPVSRGTYVLFDDLENACFLGLPEQGVGDKTRVYASQIQLSNFDTILKDKRYCTSESEVLGYAYLSSLISTFCDVRNLIATRSDKFGTDDFELNLPNSKSTAIEVKGAQIEVDGIYENEDTVVLVEVKRCISDDINVRQIYYPYVWAKSVTSKRVISLLLGYCNGVYRLTEFRCYGALAEVRVLRQEYFTIDEEVSADVNIRTVLRHSSTPEECFSVPYPQADDMNKVIDVFVALSEGFSSKEELIILFDFDARQADYYKNAVKYLGLLTDDGEISRIGNLLLRESYRSNRTEMIFKIMMARTSLRKSFLLLQSRDYNVDQINIIDIEKIIVSCGHTISGATLKRRAQTVRAWLKWLVANLNLRVSH